MLGAQAVLLFLLLAACGRPTPYKRVSLTRSARNVPTSPVRAEGTPLRVAVGAILSPQSTTHGYDRLISYLSAEMGRPVELLQRTTYAEINELLRTRQVDLAFVCTGAYIRGEQDFGMELLVIPQVDGQTIYHSYIIVPSAGPSQGLADLSGRVFAFTDPMSLSGYLVPLGLLASQGESPDAFFDRTLFTYSHDRSIQAVAEGWVDGAAVDSLVYEAEVKAHPGVKARTRIIWRSEPLGIPPAVVHPALSSDAKEQLRRILLRMHEDARGREALATMGVDRFVLADQRQYESARALLRALRGVEPG